MKNVLPAFLKVRSPRGVFGSPATVAALLPLPSLLRRERRSSESSILACW